MSGFKTKYAANTYHDIGKNLDEISRRLAIEMVRQNDKESTAENLNEMDYWIFQARQQGSPEQQAEIELSKWESNLQLYKSRTLGPNAPPGPTTQPAPMPAPPPPPRAPPQSQYYSTSTSTNHYPSSSGPRYASNAPSTADSMYQTVPPRTSSTHHYSNSSNLTPQSYSTPQPRSYYSATPSPYTSAPYPSVSYPAAPQPRVSYVSGPSSQHPSYASPQNPFATPLARESERVTVVSYPDFASQYRRR